MKIERCLAGDLDDWVRLRANLWPDSSVIDLRAEAIAMLSEENARAMVFLGRSHVGATNCFAEARIRHDPVNGCDTRPVVFLEGVYVVPEYRRRGYARSLCAAIESWGRTQGCVEFGSDALLDNHVSHSFHSAMGFEERERVVCFRKLI